MDKRVLACVVAMAAGVMNIVPWGGPLLRAAASLHVPVADLFRPLLPVMAIGLAFVFTTAFGSVGVKRGASRRCRRPSRM